MNIQSFKKIAITAALLAAITAGTQTASAAVIAIADSGTDVTHPDLKAKLWNNPGEFDNAVDNDDDGMIGNVHGWNFVDGNNKYYNKKLVGTFGPDVYKFFDVQTRMLKGTMTQEDKDWINKMRKDPKFIAQLNAFGNFVHGTHVAGITSKNVDASQIMALKVIGTKSMHLFTSIVMAAAKAAPKGNGFAAENDIMDKAIRFGLDYLAQAQGQALGPVGEFIGENGAQVANCSFGTSAAALTPMLSQLLKVVMPKITPEQIAVYVNYTIERMSDVMEKSFVGAAPHTLFVIAAGNDGTNNDVMPTSPANVKTDNAITVAATDNNNSIASFSNYGQKVDVGAPGVAIVSTIPGKEYLALSGTSQATPFVANVAGQIFDANPKLSPADAKRILMDTVDHKEWMVGKVKSEGTVNQERALYAARASTSMTLSEAIMEAKMNVLGGIADTIPSLRSNLNEKDLYVVPLPSTLQ